MAILYTMTVDTEEEWDWNGGYPTDDPQVRNIDRLPRFQELCERFGVRTTYFTDHAVVDNPQSRAVMQELGRRPGVEVGMHIHPWNTPPIPQRGSVRPRDTYLHNLPPELIRQKLATVYEALTAAGFVPTSFRGGRYSSGGVIHDFLYEHGFLADASVLPHTRFNEEGAPDYSGRGLEPRRLPPRQPGGAPLWEVPLTRGYTRRPYAFWAGVYQTIETSFLRKMKLIGLLQAAGVVQRYWLDLDHAPAEEMLVLLNRVRAMRVPCVCFTMHSSRLLPGFMPYARTQDDVSRFYATAERVFAAVAGWPEFRPATVTEVARHLEERYHARSRD